MAEILLVNPRRRRRRRKTSARRRRRSSARSYAPRRRRRRSYASVAPRRRRRRRAVAVMSNPRRRRRRSFLTRSHRRRRRNPSFRGLGGGVIPTLKAGFVGAAGALGLDLLWGQTARFMPAQIAASPIAQYAAKLLGAIVVGWAGNKILRGRGRDLAVGATTVVLHDALKAQLSTSFPQLNLGEYLTFAPTVGSMPRAGRLMSTGMGEYLSGIPDRNGEDVSDDMNYSSNYNADGLNGAY